MTPLLGCDGIKHIKLGGASSREDGGEYSDDD
jgi:hypothetical protein